MKQPDFIFKCKKCPAVAAVTMDANGWTYVKFRQTLGMTLAHDSHSGHILYGCESAGKEDNRIIEDSQLDDILLRASNSIII